jgi:hypothetical protein
MRVEHYRDLILRAVKDGDDERIDLLAAHLIDCETAKQLLRAKGYGTAGMSLSSTARLVSDASAESVLASAKVNSFDLHNDRPERVCRMVR